MKIIICIGIVISTALLSKALAEKFIVRDKFYLELVEFIKEIERNIRLLKEPLSKIQKREGGNIERILCDVDCIDEMNFLADKEKMKIKTFFQTFGKSDSALEEKRVQSFLQELMEQLKIVESERAKKVPLYLKLGVVIGSAIVIVLV